MIWRGGVIRNGVPDDRLNAHWRKYCACLLYTSTELFIPVAETKGYITKATREKLLVLPKSHTRDALAIAQGRHGFGIKAVSYTHLPRTG